MQPREYAATAFAILEMFGLEDSVSELLGGNINNLQNVLTMDAMLHRYFDRFDLWLEPDPDQVSLFR